MIGYSKIKSYAKVNLALNVVAKNNLLHKIESIISFLNLHDEISIKVIKNKNHKIKFVGKFSNNISSDNTVSKLFKIIDKKKLLKNMCQRPVHLNEIEARNTEAGTLPGGYARGGAHLLFR